VFEWGFGGSGPVTLARAIRTVEYGPEVAEYDATAFALDVIVALPREQGGLEWVLDSKELAIWRLVMRLLADGQDANDH
jgi:hypothetical protein